jgi:hypothetical protein
MRKPLVALIGGLLAVTFAACGGDSPSTPKAASSSSSNQRSSSTSSSSVSGGGSVEAFCSQIAESASLFSTANSGRATSDQDYDAFIKAFKDLNAVAPAEIAADMKAYTDLVIAALTASKAAPDDRDAQQSAFNKVTDADGDRFGVVAKSVDEFATDSCGVRITGEPPPPASS